MARNKRTKTVVQALDAHSLLARTLLEAGSHSGADDNMEIYYSDEDSQSEEKVSETTRKRRKMRLTMKRLLLSPVLNLPL